MRIAYIAAVATLFTVSAVEAAAAEQMGPPAPVSLASPVPPVAAPVIATPAATIASDKSLSLIPSQIGSAGESARSERIKVAVLDLVPNGVTPELASTLTGVLANELNRLQVFAVITNQDIRAMVTHDAMAQLVGCEGTTKCSSNLIGALGTQYLVSGNVGSVGQQSTLNFVLTDVQKGTVEGRASAVVDDPVKLLDAAARSSQVLVAKVLAARQGMLLVTCSERGATVKIDGQLLGTTPLSKRSIGWGPHRLEVEKAGFVMAAEDISVQGSGLLDRHYQLSPSQDYLGIYETKAKRMRIAAWTTTGVAAASLAGALYFQFAHIRDASTFTSARSTYESMESPTQAQYDSLASLRNQAESDIQRTYILTGVGVLLAGTALYFWLAGDDPSKYAAYREASSPAEPSPPPKPVTFRLLDIRGGIASLSW